MTIGTATSLDLDIELNAQQYEFVFDDASPFSFYVGGVGAGKTYAGDLKAIRKAISQPGSLGLIGAPTYPLLRDTTMRTLFQMLPEELIANWSITNAHLTLANGSEILFRSMDEPDRIRGLNLAWFYLDEAPLCGHYAWQVLKARLRQSGYETQGFATGTPHGRDGYAKDFELEPRPGHTLYRASTHANLHNLPEGYIESLGYTGNFALQEIEGLFVSFEGLVYQLREEWHSGEWTPTLPDGNPHRPAMRLGGVDWGYGNPAVALPLYVDHDQRVYVVDEFYQRQVGLTGASDTIGLGGQSAAILDFSQRYGIETWYCGPDEPEHIAALNAMFSKHNLKARAVGAIDEITPGIETVRRFLALRTDNTPQFKLSARCVQTKSEFQTYKYPDRKDGIAARDPQEKPIKAFDHAMDALRYALHSALGRKQIRAMWNVPNPATPSAREASPFGGVRLKDRRF